MPTSVYSINVSRPAGGAAGLTLPTARVDAYPLPGPEPADDIQQDEEVLAALPESTPAPKALGPYYKIRRALRGRYRQAVALGILGAIVGMVAGWGVSKPRYRSEGSVRIAYSKPAAGSDTDQNAPIPMFESYMRTQLTVLQSHRLVGDALHGPEWQATGRSASPDVVEAVANALEVTWPRGGEYFEVAYVDEDPAIASAVVRSVIRTFADEFVERNKRTEEHRIQLLDSRRVNLQRQWESLQAKINSITQDVGTYNLDQLYIAAQQRVLMLESKVMDLNLSIMLSQSEAAQEPTVPGDVPASVKTVPPTKSAPLAGGKRPEGLESLTIAKIEAMDPLMHNYVVAQDAVREQWEAAKSHGWGDHHPEVARLAAQLRKMTERVENYANDYRAQQAIFADMGADAHAAPSIRLPGKTPVASRGSLDLLRAHQGTITRMLEQTRGEIALLNAKRAESAPYVIEAQKIRMELDSRTTRKDSLEMELAMGSRLEVLNSGDVPVRPFRDLSRKMAMAGAAGGAAMPVGLLLLFGMYNRRYRFSDEAQTDVAANAPLLGILPTLTATAANREQAASAAHAVHQIRVMLQVTRPERRQGVYLVTSSVPGDGKTSIALSLALSFAASGTRTLLIDGDIVGQRLTLGLGAAKYIGLREVLTQGTLRGSVRRTPTNGLFVLPTGTTEAADATCVSSEAMRRLLREARKVFDVIIIDSGPILGSIEATAIAPTVDGVIFAIARGQHPSIVEKALGHVKAIGAPLAGFIFNRAEAGDFTRSANSSLRSFLGKASGDADTPSDVPWKQFGPLVEAMADMMPASRPTTPTPSNGASVANR